MQNTFTTVQCKLFIHQSGLFQYEYATLSTRKESFSLVMNLIHRFSWQDEQIHSFNWHLVSALSASAGCSNNARIAFICTCSGHHWPGLICMVSVTILIHKVFYCFIIQCKKTLNKSNNNKKKETQNATTLPEVNMNSFISFNLRSKQFSFPW